MDLLGQRPAARVYATIADDGVGGAEAGADSGLTGLADHTNLMQPPSQRASILVVDRTKAGAANRIPI